MQKLSLNIRGYAEQFGYSVRIDRHGKYTNYFLTNAKGEIRIERDAVKGHMPIIVYSSYKIAIPAKFTLFPQPNKLYVVVEFEDSVPVFANINDYDLSEIVKNNK